jgi:hypothetical protein
LRLPEVQPCQPSSKLLEALLAYRRGRMTDEQRAIATALDFQARWRAYEAWRARQKLSPETHALIGAMLTRRPSASA